MVATEAKQVANANSLFSSDMYDAMRSDRTKNFVFSPFSLSAAVGMVKIGARGESATELQKAFHFPQDSVLEKGFCRILTDLNKENENYTLKASNRLFLQNEYIIEDEYEDSVTKSFLAGTENLNFGKNEEASRRINAWVEEMTENKIKNIVEPRMFNSNTRLVLVNTLYFKADWARQFKRESTKKDDFFVTEKDESSKVIKVDMMRMTKMVEYGEIPEMDAKAVALSYKDDGEKDLIMIIIAPNTKTGVTKIEENIKNYAPERILGMLKNVVVVVRLPRFKFTCGIDCIPFLKKMGVNAVFSKQNADLSGISAKDDLHVGILLQKVFIQVDEKGTEAAAATAVAGECMAAKPSGKTRIPPRFDADRPFIFQVVDRKQNLVFFSGRCSDPLQKS